MADIETDAHSGMKTTGHEWDGIKELNTPLPRWWLIVFYASIIWSLVYWVFMPAWPGISGYTQGLRGHSERANVTRDIAELDAARAEDARRLIAAPSLSAIENDPDLLQFAMAAGQSLFGDNCATCHGAGGQGFKGYPALVDDAWLWGGKLEDIRTTIRYGIRSEHPEARLNVMQAYGRDGILPREDINAVVEHVMAISGQEADPDLAAKGAEIFAVQCTACHGEAGMGNHDLGAPNLTDAIWLYGGDRETVFETLWNGRGGVMPAWTDRLSDADIAALSVYVHALGGGE